MDPVTAKTKKRIDERETAGDMWEVFARRRPKDALTHVGSVSAPNERLAIARAWWTFSHFEWIEMYVAPSGSFAPVIKRSEVRIGAV